MAMAIVFFFILFVSVAISSSNKIAHWNTFMWRWKTSKKYSFISPKTKSKKKKNHKKNSVGEKKKIYASSILNQTIGVPIFFSCQSGAYLFCKLPVLYLSPIRSSEKNLSISLFPDNIFINRTIQLRSSSSSWSI